MSTSPKQQLKSVARATTAPARNYINNHFEMTKDEVRSLVEQIASLDHTGRNESVLELGNVVAETAMYQSRMIADVRADVAAMRTQIDDLSTLVDRLVKVVAAMNTTEQHPDAPPAETGT